MTFYFPSLVANSLIFSLVVSQFADEPKLNSGSWEDPLPLSHATKHSYSFTAFAARRTEPFSSIRRGKINTFQYSPFAAAAANGLTVSAAHNRRRLEQTVYARTISADESWCSERNNGHEHDHLSSDGEDDDKKSISSITSTSTRNSHLRSTLHKARQHLSFDKWRNSLNSSNSNSSANTTMMTTHPHESSLSPGESTPGGRLSRWFSIRRGSAHQYDFGGSGGGKENGRDSRASSIEADDRTKQIPVTINGHKMPLLPEVMKLS